MGARGCRSGRRFAADPSRAAHVCMRASDGRRSVHVLVCVTAYVAGACDLCRVVSGSLRSLGCLCVCVCVVGKCVHVCVMVHAVRGLHRRSAFKHTVLAGSAGSTGVLATCFELASAVAGAPRHKADSPNTSSKPNSRRTAQARGGGRMARVAIGRHQRCSE